MEPKIEHNNYSPIPNPTCSSIDSNTKPLTVQQFTKSSCTNYSSTETSSTIRNDSKSVCDEESKKLPAISKGSESKIQNSQELNSENFHKTLSGVYLVAQGFTDNQTSINSSTHYGMNNMTHQLPHHGRVSRHQNLNYSYGSNKYFFPETDVSYNPFYVNNRMYQKDLGSKNNTNASESKNNRFRQFNSTLYDYLPVVYESKSDLSYKKQPLASQQMKSQVNVIHESKMKDRSLVTVNTINVSDKQNIAQISTSDNKVDVSSNSDISEELYSPSSYQNYADSFVESARQLAAFEEQFADAPYQFLQPEEDDEPTEYSKLQSRLLQYNLKRNTSDSSDSFAFSDSDDGITVEIEQFQDYEKYFKMSQGDTQIDSTCNQLNLLGIKETVTEQITSLNKEVSHLDKSEDLFKCTSNQLNLLETTEAVIEQSISLNKEVKHLDISQEIEPKVSDEPEDKDAIVDISIESGYYLVQVRDVATQFPEYDENLSTTSTAKVDKPSSSKIETQLCTTINKEEVFSFTSTSVTSVKNKRTPRKKSKKQRSK